MERANVITIKGKPLTLLGRELKVGDRAPEFTLLDNSLSAVKLSDSRGKARLLSVVPSLDMDVCSIQTRTFNNKAAELSERAAFYTISADLPYAQSRFTRAHKIDRVQTLSDYRDNSFGNEYGLLIKELRLLARAVLVVDKDDRITHLQIVPDVATEPNYTAALKALKEAVG
ncbi:MAG: thiol peroxidase [Candidatus Zixiibacteriota bacterium]|nr:MAG: thiol peroxidase [candidate division Zixibacteria bacterium]